MKKAGILVLIFIFTFCTVIQFDSAGVLAAQNGQAPDQVFDHDRTAMEQLESLFTTMDIMDATIGELTEEMEKGNVTSEQITRMYIDRIKAYDKKVKLNSIISIDPSALKQARERDEERAQGKIRGPLHGIPILIKDNIDVAGTATTGGSLALADMIADKDAFVVRKLREAGAVIIAKTNLSEFASSAVDSKSLIGGVVHNAYDTSRVPAGSSGGTGVAVTSNFAAAGLGTDTGGSIRNPSSYSNLYGLRPSKGLTSTSGVIPLIGPRDTVGPMARTAEDAALIMETIAGTDENDDFTTEANADELVGSGYSKSLSVNGLKGKRIGYLTASFQYDPDRYETEEEEEEEPPEEPSEEPPEEVSKEIPDEKIDAMIKRTRADLRKAGAQFVDLSEEITDERIFEKYWACNIDEVTEYDFNKYLHDKGDIAPYKTLKELCLSGTDGIDFTNLPIETDKIDQYADSFETTPNPYDTEINGFMRGKSWQDVLTYRAEVDRIMQENDIDAIMYIASLDVVPTYARLEDELKINRVGFYYGFAFGPCLGLPDICIPMGFSDTDDKVGKELPLGMRLFGKYGDEANLLDMAYAYEQQAGDQIRRMPESTPPLEDENLAAFLEALMEEVHSIDYSRYADKPEGKIKNMEKAYDQAAAADTTDPEETYRAAAKLAKAYDKVIGSLKNTAKVITKATVSGVKDMTYTGKALTQKPVVILDGRTLVPDTDYTVSYQNNKNAGTAVMTVNGKGKYAGSTSKDFKIKKASNLLKIKGKTAKVRYSRLKKKACSLKVSKLISFKRKGNGKMAYKLTKAARSGKKGTKSSDVGKFCKLSKKTGKLTIKKGLKKGAYTLSVKAKAAGDNNHKASAYEKGTVKIVVN